MTTEIEHADTETGLKFLFFLEVLSFVRQCVGVPSTGINIFAT